MPQTAFCSYHATELAPSPFWGGLGEGELFSLN